MGNFQSTGIYDFSQNMSPHHPVSHSPLVSNFITGSSPGTLSNNEVSMKKKIGVKYLKFEVVVFILMQLYEAAYGKNLIVLT